MLPSFGCMLALSLGLVMTLAPLASADPPRRPARIFVLMVWDGLRPDFVTAERTPNLFAMENEGGALRAASFGLSDDHDGKRGNARNWRAARQYHDPR